MSIETAVTNNGTITYDAIPTDIGCLRLEKITCTLTKDQSIIFKSKENKMALHELAISLTESNKEWVTLFKTTATSDGIISITSLSNREYFTKLLQLIFK